MIILFRMNRRRSSSSQSSRSVGMVQSTSSFGWISWASKILLGHGRVGIGQWGGADPAGVGIFAAETLYVPARAAWPRAALDHRTRAGSRCGILYTSACGAGATPSCGAGSRDCARAVGLGLLLLLEAEALAETARARAASGPLPVILWGSVRLSSGCMGGSLILILASPCAGNCGRSVMLRADPADPLV